MASPVSITAREFEKYSNTGGQFELVRGRVVDASFSEFEEGRLACRVGILIESWADEHSAGRVVTNIGVIVEHAPDTVRGADIAFYSYDRLPKSMSPSGFLDIPPTLIVEIVGKGSGWNELLEKVCEYLQMGVDLVWVFDASSRRLHVFRKDAEPVILESTGRIENEPCLPKFSLKIEDLFDN